MSPISRIFSGLVVTLLFISGCAVDIPVPKIEIPPGAIKVTINDADLQKELDNIAGNALVCSAGLPASAGGVVKSGVATPIEVSAKGGTAPYQILGTAVGFSSQTVISRTYTNNGSSNVLVVDTVSVVDNLGLVTQCNYVVTVLPANNPSNLACTLTSTPTTANINDPISLVVTASGGTPGYTFSNLNLASGGSVISSLAPINSTQASASVKFSSSGMKTNNVKVTDTAGNFVVCSSTVTIQSNAQVSLVASPSSSVQVGSAILVTAIPANFSSAPTSYTFSTQEAGVSLVPNGSAVTVTSSNGLAHSNFTVSVVASNGVQQASNSIQLSFTPVSGYLSCSITHPAGTYKVGDNVTFTASSSTGEALTITNFIATSDAVLVASSNNSRTLKYANPGSKVVYALAKSSSTGQWCNDGNYLVDSLDVSSSGTLPLACSAYTYYNPTNLAQSFYAYGVLTGGNPANRWVESLRVLQNGNVVNNYSGYWYDRYTAVLAIYQTRGTYQIELTAKDSLGNTATCSTNHIVQ